MGHYAPPPAPAIPYLQKLRRNYAEGGVVEKKYVKMFLDKFLEKSRSFMGLPYVVGEWSNNMSALPHVGLIVNLKMFVDEANDQ